MIDIQKVSFRYKKKSLFKDLDFRLPAGNIAGLLGKNGSGKTTLMKLIAGLRFPKSGNVEVLGFDASQRHPDMVREIFFVPEQFAFPKMTAKQYIKYVSVFYPRFDHEQMRANMDVFGLQPDGLLQEYSMGQKKQILLSFALASNAKLLLLDEPTNGLDIPSKSKLKKVLIQGFSEERSIIISTHMIRDVEFLLDRIVVLDDGSIVFNHETAAISQVLSFGEAGQNTDALYSEEGLGGYKCITPNRGGDSNIDLELLFNAIISDPQSINAPFHQQPTSHV